MEGVAVVTSELLFGVLDVDFGYVRAKGVLFSMGRKWFYPVMLCYKN